MYLPDISGMEFWAIEVSFIAYLLSLTVIELWSCWNITLNRLSRTNRRSYCFLRLGIYSIETFSCLRSYGDVKNHHRLSRNEYTHRRTHIQKPTHRDAQS